MIEIKAGRELDRAVAEAIGWIATHKVLGGIDAFVNPREGAGATPMVFMPSVDLNDAFRAAESVELFQKYLLSKMDSGWMILDIDPCGGCEVIGPDKGCPTPALAICAAILKRK